MLTVGCYRDRDSETMCSNSWHRENRHALICMDSVFFFFFKLSRATKGRLNGFLLSFSGSDACAWRLLLLPVDQDAATIWLRLHFLLQSCTVCVKCLSVSCDIWDIWAHVGVQLRAARDKVNRARYLKRTQTRCCLSLPLWRHLCNLSSITLFICDFMSN